MRRYRKGMLLTLVLFFGMGMNVHAEVVNGKPAPAFTLTDTSGENHALSDYQGKFVVLEWFNPDCPFVKNQYRSGNIPNLQKKYMGKGVIWLVINSAAPGKQGGYPPKKAAEIMKMLGGNPVAFLLDGDGKIGKMYGAKTTPHLFIIDTRSNLVYQGAIDSIPSTNPAGIAKAQNYVQLALDESMAGKPVTVLMTKSYGCSVKY